MVDLVTSSLVSAVQRQASPTGAQKSGSTAEPSVIELGSDTLTRNSQNKTSGLVFGPSAGFFADNNAFVTVASAGSNTTQNYGSSDEDSFNSDVFNTNNNNNSGVLFDLFSTRLSTAASRLTALLDPNNQPVFVPATSDSTEPATEAPESAEQPVENTEAPTVQEPPSSDTGSGSTGGGGTTGGGDTGGGTTTPPPSGGPGNSGNANGKGNNGSGGGGKTK